MNRAVDTEVAPMVWKDGALELLDQRELPARLAYRRCHSAPQVAEAIRDMVVRGAPAIGIAAAYGVALSFAQHWSAAEPARNAPLIADELELLARSRPTAVNLAWALAEMQRVRSACGTGDPRQTLLEEAQRIHRQDIEQNRRMGELGAALIEPGSTLLTHCNTGALATGGYGTALGVIRSAWRRGLVEKIYATETRPWLQGARLTAWELGAEGIPVTLLVDSAVALLFRSKQVAWLVVGADRIAANGDVANKIGTCGAAMLASQFGVRVMVVAPVSTIDMTLANGELIPLELRDGAELRSMGGRPITPAQQEVWNPVFDITPARFVDILVTERGVVERPDVAAMERLFA